MFICTSAIFIISFRANPSICLSAPSSNAAFKCWIHQRTFSPQAPEFHLRLSHRITTRAHSCDSKVQKDTQTQCLIFATHPFTQLQQRKKVIVMAAELPPDNCFAGYCSKWQRKRKQTYVHVIYTALLLSGKTRKWLQEFLHSMRKIIVSSNSQRYLHHFCSILRRDVAWSCGSSWLHTATPSYQQLQISVDSIVYL